MKTTYKVEVVWDENKVNIVAAQIDGKELPQSLAHMLFTGLIGIETAMSLIVRTKKEREL